MLIKIEVEWCVTNELYITAELNPDSYDDVTALTPPTSTGRKKRFQYVWCFLERKGIVIIVNEIFFYLLEFDLFFDLGVAF